MAVLMNDSFRMQALTALYNHVETEITRYRDYEWKILSWVLLLLGAVATVSRALPGSGDVRVVLRTLLVLFALATAIYGAWHIHFVHLQLTWNRRQRRKIEGLLEFYQRDTYKVGVSVLPEAWASGTVSYKQGLGHLVSWWGLIGLVATYTIFSLLTS